MGRTTLKPRSWAACLESIRKLSVARVTMGECPMVWTALLALLLLGVMPPAAFGQVNSDKVIAIAEGEALWQSEQVNIVVDYEDGWLATVTGVVTKPGVIAMRLHFSEIQVETSYDHLWTGDGDFWSGVYTDVTSTSHAGESINLQMTTNNSVPGRFVIDRVDFVGDSTSPAVFSGRLFDDVASWTWVEVDHIVPYQNNWTGVYGEVRLPGASEIRLAISDLVLEEPYDILSSDAGDIWTGAAERVTSGGMPGDTMGLTLYSDSSTPGSFRVTGIGYKGSVTDIPEFTGPLFNGGPVEGESAPEAESVLEGEIFSEGELSWRTMSADIRVRYLDNWVGLGTIQVPGVRALRVHFSEINLERGFDSLYSSAGDYWSGSYVDVYSQAQQGDTFSLTLVSDALNSGGFRIDEVQYLGVDQGGLGWTGNLFEEGAEGESDLGDCGTPDSGGLDNIAGTWFSSSELAWLELPGIVGAVRAALQIEAGGNFVLAFYGLGEGADDVEVFAFRGSVTAGISNGGSRLCVIPEEQRVSGFWLSYSGNAWNLGYDWAPGELTLFRSGQCVAFTKDAPIALSECAQQFGGAEGLRDPDADGLNNIKECERGTQLGDSDSDDDGLPDGLEVEVLLLNPLDADSDANGITDADEDADFDGLSNLEEFLRKTDPMDASDPATIFFVAPDGSEENDGLSPGTARLSIQSTMDDAGALATAENPVRILIAGGEYPGAVVLRPFVTLSKMPSKGIPVIVGAVTGASHSALERVEVRAAGGDSTLVELNGVSDMLLKGCILSADGNANVTGVDILGEGTGQNVVEFCRFFGLHTCVHVGNNAVIPVIRRCVFKQFTHAAIVVETSQRKAAGEAGMGARGSGVSGFNLFEGYESSARLVVNRSGKTLRMEENEWGVEGEEEIAKYIENEGESESDFVPYLPKSGAILAAAVYCVVTNSDGEERVDNAKTWLQIPYGPVTENEDGVYAFPAVQGDQIYSAVAQAGALQDATASVNVAAGASVSITLAMREDSDGTEGEGEGEDPGGCRDSSKETTCGAGGASPSARADALFLLLAVGAFLCLMRGWPRGEKREC